jgi:hypothetical protein
MINLLKKLTKKQTQNLNISTKELPRNVIKELYKIDLPIKGGWGYGIDDVCIIDKLDESVNQNIPFDGVNIEYIFIEKRNYAELINTRYSKEVYRKDDNSYAHIEWNVINQRTFDINGTRYDHLEFQIECVTREVFEQLSKLAEDKNNLEKVWKIHEKEKLIFKRECYFDITSFYGRNKT